jgi:hypothetical protein
VALVASSEIPQTAKPNPSPAFSPSGAVQVTFAFELSDKPAASSVLPASAEYLATSTADPAVIVLSAEQTTGAMPEQTAEATPEKTAETTPDQTTETTPDQTTETTPDQTAETTPEQTAKQRLNKPRNNA